MHVLDDPQFLTVEAVTTAWLNNSIRPNPEYQRGSTWKLRQQQLLVDSVFRGYPLPRFYFQQKASIDVLGNRQVGLDVIDGQQRIIALSQYRDDKWPLFQADDERVALPDSVRRQVAPWAGRTFSALSTDLQQHFLQLQLSVVLIDEVEQDEVRDLFIRLQAGTPLTPQQVRDAWPGNVGPYIERLAGKGNRQGAYAGLFQAIDRRGQGGRTEDEYYDPALDARQTCSQLLLLLINKERGRGQLSLNSSALDDLYHESTNFDTHGQTAQAFEQLLEDVGRVLELRDRQGKKVVRKGRVFSLFLFLRLLRFSPIDVRRAIPQIAELFWSSETDNSEPVGRVGAAGTLDSHFSWFLNVRMAAMAAPELDRNRSFSAGQKVEIYNSYGGRCGICNQPVDGDEAEYDHIRPWILGGPTQMENGRPVHPRCHLRGLAAVGGGSDTPVS